MESLADQDLFYLEMDDSAFGEDPAPHFARARSQHPWLAKCLHGYVVHSYVAIQDLLWMDDSMHIATEQIIAVMGAENSEWGRFQRENLFGITGAEHKRIRDLAAPAFTPRQANLNRGLMRNVISDLLDEWVPKGAFDFEEFASNFPVRVICSLVGAPASEVPRLRSSLEAIGLSHSMDRSLFLSMEAGIVLLSDFCREVIEERRSSVRPSEGSDLLDALLAATENGGLTDRELIDLMITLLVGGYDTSKNLLTLIMNELIKRPDVHRRCAESLEFCKKVVDEALRYRPISTTIRETARDIDYRGICIPAGTTLIFALYSAAHDPEKFDDPDSFDPDRPQGARHMSFGRGIHMCLGQFIARAQVEEGLHLIAQRIRHPRTSGPQGWRPFFGASGIKGLPIEFEPQ
jgi:cytochrome P450